MHKQAKTDAKTGAAIPSFAPLREAFRITSALYRPGVKVKIVMTTKKASILAIIPKISEVLSYLTAPFNIRLSCWKTLIKLSGVNEYDSIT